MKAAVVSRFGQAPRFDQFPLPTELGPHEEIVEVVATGLHPRVRSQADGSHYTSIGEVPLVPGIDGVGRAADGELRYFILPDTALGSMAEQTVIDRRRSVAIPSAADPIQIAAAMNPAMSSWIALRRRIDMPAGQSVMILGATGNAGRLAIQVAKHLGAARVIAVGRGADRLKGLGADSIVSLDENAQSVTAALGEAGERVDVVLDYLWGTPTHDALSAIIPRRADDDQTLSWIQIGSVAGVESAIPSAALRATNLHLIGSGQGSVSTRDIVSELESLAEAVTSDAFTIGARSVPLHDVETEWNRSAETTDRVVFTPSRGNE
ncbi:quinone oxidoreductase family protein [Agreia bicolorata]|uniref:Quinone oxidoreductase n=1 Tax=Agreia bicolorata TaxID=110935 RepID=A0ABR5CDD1_9MICO|nr:zinc-binding alcohol dehydrogenase family protein [Agreia bicolorata]KJC63625.1 quinone oxidoreductase [Agreia bicolorata]